MPAFLDWWDLLGTGIQSVFAWVTFNRDAFADNVSWRQAQKYQQKNYHISWIAVARDDIRDMMGISVNRINNYMLVATLILSAAAGAITSASFNTACPAFLVYAFFVCVAISICFLTLSIMFGIKGQNTAFTKTMQLLTFQVRPENPADYNHDYMTQAQWIEKKGLRELFRIPGLRPNYGVESHWLNSAPLDKRMSAKLRKEYGIDRLGSAPDQRRAAAPEDQTPLENLDVSSDHLWYLTKFADFMRLWLPYDKYAKYSMGLGIIALGQAAAYFCVASLISQGWGPLPEYSTVIGCFCFTYMIVIVVYSNVKHTPVLAQLFLGCLLWIAPCLSVVGAVSRNETVVDIVVPISFACHALFWLATLIFSFGLDRFESHHMGFASSENFWKGRTKEPQDDSRRSLENQRRAAEGLGKPAAAHDWGMWEDTPEQDPDSDDRAAGPMGAEGKHWPTDDAEFLPKVGETTDKVKRVLRLTLFMSFLVWALLFIWNFHSLLADDPSSPFLKSFVASETTFAVKAWPTFFRPHAIACVGDSIFLADEYRVFRIQDGKPEEYPCSLNSTILDITASCDDKSMLCKPLVLSDGLVVDCSSGQAMRFLQEAVSPDFIAARAVAREGLAGTELKLVAAHGAKLVMYRWNQLQDGWLPEWQLGLLAEPSLRSISIEGEKLLLFNAREPNNIAVHRRNLGTMQLDGSWALGSKAAPLVAGCARAQGNSALILPLSASPPGALKPLVEVSLM